MYTHLWPDRTPDLEALLKKWFPKAEILKQDKEIMNRKKSAVLDTYKIHICKIGKFIVSFLRIPSTTVYGL